MTKICRYFKDECGERIRLRKIDETVNYLLDETKHYDWVSEKIRTHVGL